MSPRRNNPDNEPKQTNHNQDPSNPNVHRDQDPAVRLVDPLRALYRYADSDQQREALFQPDGFDGAYDLLEVANDVRQSGGRQLDEGEQLLARYVDIQAQNVVLSSGINFTALEEDYTTKDGTKLSYQDAAATRISNVIRSLKGKIDRSSDDEKVRLNEQRKSLYAYRKLYQDGEMIEPGSLSAGREFMAALHEVRNDSSQEKQQAIQKAAIQLNKSVDTFAVQMKAFQAILEHGRKEYLQTPTPLDEGQIDERLHYVAVPPTQTQPASAQSAPSKDVLKERRERTENQLASVREELAYEKSRTFQRLLRSSRLGRRALAVFGIDAAKQEENIEKLEERYAVLAHRSFGLAALDELKTANTGDKAALIASSIIGEQDKLREATNKRLRTKLVARFCQKLSEYNWRSIKSKHYWVMGGAAALAMFTPVGGLAIGMGAGMLAAAKHDAKTRGLREKTHEAINSEAMRQHLLVEIKRQIQNKKSGSPSNNPGKEVFDAGIREAMRHFDNDLDRENRKRALSLALGGVAMVSANIGVSNLDALGEPAARNWDNIWNSWVDWAQNRPRAML